MRLNRPIRSTTHAVCCGTNLTTVLAGSVERWKYEGVLDWPVAAGGRNMLSAERGRPCREVVLKAGWLRYVVKGLGGMRAGRMVDSRAVAMMSLHSASIENLESGTRSIEVATGEGLDGPNLPILDSRLLADAREPPGKQTSERCSWINEVPSKLGVPLKTADSSRPENHVLSQMEKLRQVSAVIADLCYHNSTSSEMRFY